MIFKDIKVETPPKLKYANIAASLLNSQTFDAANIKWFTI